MKLGLFVTTSAVVLAGWLGLTFIHEVPSQHYPKLQKYADAGPQMTSPEPAGPAESRPEDKLMHVSVSQ
jgi:hypothetical protein